MVTERDEQMTEVEEKEREERRRKLKRRASALFAWTVMLLALSITAAAIYFLVKAHSTMWPGIAAVAVTGIIFAFLIRKGIGGRLLALVLFICLVGLFVGLRTETGNDIIADKVPGDNDEPNYWNLFSNIDKRPSDFGAGCTGNDVAEYECVNIFFATPRKVEFTPHAIFTKFMEDNRLHLGRAELQVPKPGYIGGGQNAPCPDGYLCREQIDRNEVASDYTRRLDELFKVTLLTTNRDESFIDEKERFVGSFNEALRDSDNKTFLYIHGFNQTFDQAIKTAALMHVDLNGLYKNYEIDSSGAELTSRRNLGVPLVFSWPNRENGTQYLCDKGTSEPGELGHELMCGKRDKEMSVNTIAPYLNQTLRILLADTSTNELNIVVHSLGNRLLLNSLKQFASDFSSSSGRDLTVRIVHAAADVNQTEYYTAMSSAARVIASTDASSISLNPELTNYTSRTDGAHILSRIAVARLRCRLGRFYEGDWRPCEPFRADDLSLWSINASDFVARNAYEDGRTDLGHGYFENSPAVIADIGCAFAGFRPEGKERALIAVEDVQAGKKWNYYNFTSERGLSICKSTRFLPLLVDCEHTNSERDPNCDKEKIVSETRKAHIALDGFELLKASLPPSFHDFIQRFEQTIYSSNEIASIEITGYADTSGEQSLNAEVSQRRADAVEAALLNWFAERSLPAPRIIAVGRGEVPMEKNKADDTADGVRSALNRRVEVIITYSVVVSKKGS